MLGQTTRTNVKLQNLGVGQGLASLLTFQQSINSRYLMTPDDFLTESVVTGLHVASCRDDSFVHQPETTERVRTNCLVPDGSWSSSDPQ
jgi:hypothetical protein